MAPQTDQEAESKLPELEPFRVATLLREIEDRGGRFNCRAKDIFAAGEQDGFYGRYAIHCLTSVSFDVQNASPS